MFAVESLTAGVKQGETSDDSNETRQGEYTMKKKLIVIGAGGKMGFRVSRKLWTSEEYESYFCEISEAGIARLEGLGIQDIAVMETAVPEMDIVLLAVPDILIGKLSPEIIPIMKPGAMVVGLDPAAAYANVMPVRDDLAYFVVHPHHPYLFNTEVDENGEPDLFGGIVTQDCSCAVYKAPEGREEEYYAEGEKISRIIFAPVGKTFRITVEQMGMCEPGMVESIGAPMIYAIKLAYDRFVELGVPKDALFSFLMGHLRVQVAITFGLIDAKFSDGAILALENSLNQIFRDGWLDEMVSEEYVTKSILDITAAAGR